MVIGLEAMKQLFDAYNSRKSEIKQRLREFKEINSNRDVFSELCFCICTPQSKAELCDRVVKNIMKDDFVFKASESNLSKFLVGVRFHNNKAKYIVGARALKDGLKEELLQIEDPKDKREFLVNNIKGLGHKEASHFLRNIGLGEDLAILDRHILKNLVKHGLIKEIPKTLTKKNYIKIEKRMQNFAKQIRIPLAELDLLFWSLETGKVFK